MKHIVRLFLAVTCLLVGALQAQTTGTTSGADDILSKRITLAEVSAPSTPSANRLVIYVSSVDGLLYTKNDAGTVAVLGGGITPVTGGGTGRDTGTTAYALVATGTTPTGAQQTLPQATTAQILVGGGAALPVWTDATGTGAPVRASSPVVTTPSIIGSVTFASGTRQLFMPDSTTPGLNVGSVAGDPSTPNNGDLWYDSAANELTGRINGANVALGAGGGSSAWMVKITDYTAVAGDKIQADTRGGAFTITLPASAAVGDVIQIEDAALNWGVASLTIARNGLEINDGTTNYTANVIGGKLSIVYISAAYGWSIK